MRKIALMFLLLAGLVNATDYRYVTADAGGSGDGTSTSTPWSLSQMTSSATGDMVVYIKSGTYNTGTTAYAPAGDGTLVNPIHYIGCDSSWNPIVPTRSSVTGLLDTTNFPEFTSNTGYLTFAGCQYAVIRCLKMYGSRNGATFATGAYNIIDSCVSINSNTGTSAACFSSNTYSTFLNCDAALTGSSGGNAAFTLGTSGSIAYGCVVYDSPNDGILVTSAYQPIAVTNCLIYGVADACIELSATANWSVVSLLNCTLYGGSYGIKFTTSNQVAVITHIYGNAIFGQSSSPIYSGCTDGFPMYPRYCAFDNTGWSFGGTWDLLYNSYANNTITTASPTSVIFRDPANGDFRLRNSSPLIGVSHIPYNDIGFCQTGDQPLYSNVYNDSVNGVSGTLTLPTAAQVLYNVLFGPDSGTQGNFYVPAKSDVKLGVTFGNDNTEFTGEYVGSGGGGVRPASTSGGFQ